MVEMVGNSAALGEVFNISGDAVTVNRYIDVLAGVVGQPAEVVYLPDAMLGRLRGPVFSHLFGVRHHAMASLDKPRRLLGFSCRFDLRSGHENTYEWFQSKGYADVEGPMVDPMWRASWDFDLEAAVAKEVRSA
jgi:nucleoside-diphosphate-sugar epimerase